MSANASPATSTARGLGPAWAVTRRVSDWRLRWPGSTTAAMSTATRQRVCRHNLVVDLQAVPGAHHGTTAARDQAGHQGAASCGGRARASHSSP